MGIFDKIFKRPHKKDAAEDKEGQSAASSEKPQDTFGLPQPFRTSNAGSPTQVQICVIHELKRNELWLVGDQFVPPGSIARHIAKGKNFTGTIHTESANKCFDGPPLEIESFAAMFALITMKSDLGNIEYEVIKYGDRGALYVCPQCGVVMKKNLGVLDFAKSGSQIIGNTGCATCGASLSIDFVYEGKYDL